MCLDCKTQLEQVQTTGDLEDDTKKHLALRIRKNVIRKKKNTTALALSLAVPYARYLL